MAVKPRSTSNWHVMHFLVRFVGLIGLMTAIVGWFVWGVLQSEDLGLIIIAAGGCAVLFALLFELPGLFRLAFSHRGVFGFNAALQIVLALAIVIGGNYFSFYHFQRYDLTQDQIFTLDENIRTQLAQLRGETDIIVFQSGSPFGHRAKDERDKLARRAQIQQKKIDISAQRKIIEKVKDLAEQFSDFGPRFHVTVLDIEDDNFDDKMAEFRKISEDLHDTILSAPENSVFFYSREHQQVQRLSFSEIYQVDTKSSLEKKNLVLNFQGVKTFANKIFRIEEKAPRLATAVIHPVLGMQNKEMPMFTLNGAKGTLDRYNIASMDIMLRKIGEDGDLSDEPTALTYDESRYEQIEDELTETERAIQEQEKEFVEFKDLYKFWAESSLAKLNTKYIYFFRQDGRQGIALRSQVEDLKKSGIQYKFIDVDEEDRKYSTELYKRNTDIIQSVLERNKEERDTLLKEKATLKVESLAEKRRVTDVEAKTKAMLANIDLLIIPRITLLNAPTGRVIPNRIHKLDTTQLNAIKSFLKSGKPILFLLGPANDPREAPELGGGADANPLEGMLAELGFKLPKQTILYNIEAREFNERKFGGAFGGGNREVEVPGLVIDDSTLTTQFTKFRETLTPHPLRTSLKMLSRAGGKTDAGEVRIKHPRPVYYMRTTIDPKATAALVGGVSSPGFAGSIQASAAWLSNVRQIPDENAVFLVTRKESWNEDNPFIVKNKAPSFTPPKEDDPRKGTVEEPRRGPFPIGVAAETTIPAGWYDKDIAKPATARIAIIGSGGAFVGPELSPMKEKMLLDVVNWLIGRDDLLAKEADTWQYPRVEMKEVQFAPLPWAGADQTRLTLTASQQFNLWAWGARLWLPLAFVFLGIVVTMARQMR